MFRVISFVFLFGILGCTGKTKNKPAPVILHDREIDRIKLIDLEGKPIDLKLYSGKTLFINFWATWCKPCIEEMPSIERAKKILEKEDVIFLLASPENNEEIESFKNTHAYQFDFIRIENDEEMGVQAFPTTFIFDSKGNLVFSETGSRRWDEKANIDMVLKIATSHE